MVINKDYYPTYNPTYERLEHAIQTDPAILTAYAKKTDLVGKQDKLIAGEHITINGNVISADGVDASTLQQIESNKQTIAQQQREINALIKMQGGQIYDFELAQGEHHSLDVPSGVKLCDVVEINGRSVKVNQLFGDTFGKNSSSTYYSSGDVVYTVEGRKIVGTFTVDKEMSSVTLAIYFTANTQPIKWVQGHKYYIALDFHTSFDYTTLSTKPCYFYTIASSGLAYGTNRYRVITTYNGEDSNSTTFRFYSRQMTASVKVGDTFTLEPKHCVDLTVAGLENLTVEQCEELFDRDLPYDSVGVIEHVTTNAIVSRGKNLFDVSKTYLTLNADGSGLIVNSSGYSMDFYTKKGGAGHSCSLADLPKIPIYKAGTYTFSVGTVSSGWIILLTVDDDGKVSELGKLYDNQSLTFTFDTNTRVTMRRSVNASGTYYTNIMVEKGDNATSYSPYRETTIPIPSSITSLEGYGCSAVDVYNKVDFVNREFIQRVGRILIRDLSITYNSTYNCFVSEIIGKKAGLASPMLCGAEIEHKNVWVADSAYSSYDKIVSGNPNNNSIYFKDSRYTKGDDFKQAMQGVYLYYELAEPITTDITTDLVEFTPAEVEAGGTITFANTENLAIPIKYQLEYATLLKEVARYE